MPHAARAWTTLRLTRHYQCLTRLTSASDFGKDHSSPEGSHSWSVSARQLRPCASSSAAVADPLPHAARSWQHFRQHQHDQHQHGMEMHSLLADSDQENAPTPTTPTSTTAYDVTNTAHDATDAQTPTSIYCCVRRLLRDNPQIYPSATRYDFESLCIPKRYALLSFACWKFH